jgi:quinoprotein glucose dehydrogenase
MRRPNSPYWVAFFGLFACLAITLPAAAQLGAVEGEWRFYGADAGSTKYAPLAEINRENVAQLQIAWRWNSIENEMVQRDRRLMSFAHEATPLMVNGVLYTITSHSVAVALNPETGEELWRYDPESYKAGRPTNLGFIQRGLAWWSDGVEERLFMPTGDSRLIALDAKSGRPVASWGDKGQVNLLEGLRRPVESWVYSVNSPPIVCRDVVVVGSIIFDGPSRKEMPPGDVRGFDARTGALRWTFVSVPQPGQFGHETWEDGSWEYTGNTNVWTLMSADPELGHVYLPFGTPTNDWYGGHRPGDNLFGDTLVCVKAETGERVWHFQHVHHGLWDYDLPAAPVLANITVDGRPIKALAQITKQGFCWVLDRETGAPVWPIEERPVPQSTVPGEKTSPTQPFPTRPAPYAPQGLSEEELIDFTPELREEARRLLEAYHAGPLYTPPATDKPTINFPGWAGAANWNGCALDPETGMLYIPVKKTAIAVTLVEPDPARSNFRYVANTTMRIPGPQGLPLWKPPYAYVAALDLNTGDYAWRTTLGEGPRDHEALKALDLPPLGDGGKGFPLLTKTLLFVGQESEAKQFYALDKATGAILWQTTLPAAPTGAPITYMAGGRQYLVIAVGGQRSPAELVALRLP